MKGKKIWKLGMAVALVLAVGYFISQNAESKEPQGKPIPPSIQTQGQTANPSATAAASPTANASLSAPQSITSETDVSLIGLSGGAVAPYPVDGCPLYLPGDGHNRSYGVWGFSISGVYERNDECWEQVDSARETARINAEARLIEAQNERDRLQQCEAARERIEDAWQACAVK